MKKSELIEHIQECLNESKLLVEGNAFETAFKGLPKFDMIFEAKKEWVAKNLTIEKGDEIIWSDNFGRGQLKHTKSKSNLNFPKSNLKFIKYKQVSGGKI
jgi:hypothetical protein